MHKSLYVAWQDGVSRTWTTIAKLSCIDNEYELQFTRGIQRLSSLPHDLFRMNVNVRYRSKELLPLFKNRIPPRSRSDFARLASWMNVSTEADEIELLSKFGLIPGTDSILVYPEPSIEHGQYSLDFFVHGIRHMHSAAVDWCATIHNGDNLLPVLDVKNAVDEDAVAVRCVDPPLILGYVPAFYAGDLNTILKDRRCAKTSHLSVLKTNTDAPTQLRLLCRFVSCVPAGFRSFDTEEQTLIAPAPPRQKHVA